MSYRSSAAADLPAEAIFLVIAIIASLALWGIETVFIPSMPTWVIFLPLIIYFGIIIIPVTQGDW